MVSNDALYEHDSGQQTEDGETLQEVQQEGTIAREDFWHLSLREIEELSGVSRPDEEDEETAEAYREQAWRSYQLDVRNRDEWGTARQDNEVLL